MRRKFDSLCRAKFIFIVLGLLTLNSIFVQAQNAAAPLTAAEWQADLKFLAEEMPKRHKNLFHTMRREEFEAAVKNLHERIPAMSADEIVVGLMKITAMVGDGHTYMLRRGSSYQTNNYYPVQFYWFKDGLFVRRAAPEYAEIIGKRVVKIGKYRTEDALKTVGSLIAKDNEWGAREDAPVYLSIPLILSGLKIVEDKQKLALTVETDGKEKTVELKPSATAEEYRKPPASWATMAADAKNPIPLYQKNAGEYFWFEYLKDQKLVYVQQTAVQNSEKETVADFYKRVMKFVEANDVEKLVIDQRFNRGGNNYLNRPVVIELIKSKLNERGRLFVITGRQTFSAAQNLINEIEKYTNAIFVGEPTAARPNHFGDPTPINLPNSKLSVRVSTLWWQDFDERDRRLWTAPEVAAEISSADYRENRDPAMEEIVNYKSPATSYAEFRQELRRQAQSPNAQDISVFVKKYREFKSDARHKFIGETESLLNDFGYLLMNRKRIEDAVTVFKLNTEYYPNSANAYDSLGEAYAAAGKKDEAIAAYEKALTFDPNLQSSRDALKKLKGQ
jgi:tetratricopeptide (TPR) repeat protein